MDSTAAEDARDAKPAKSSRSAGDDDADLISGLDDDVLLRVLGLVPDARDAVRTGALSRRWLRLWTRVPALRFASRPVPRAANVDEWRAALDEFVPFVNGVLSQRSTQPAGRATIESLSISYVRESEPEQPTTMPAFVGSFYIHDVEQLMRVSVGAAQGWIRHAFQHGVKSLILDMPLPEPMRLPGGRDDHEYRDYDAIEEGDGEKKPVLLLDGLPSPPAGLETMRLALGGVRLRLSAAVMSFASLRDLSLERIKVADGSGARHLARLVSSASCPLLRKLRMSKVRFPKFRDEMRLEAGVLSELWLEDITIMSLELSTPSLRVLHMDESCHKVLSLSAPRLEEFALSFRLGRQPPRLLQVDGGLPRVLSLKLHVWSHRSGSLNYGQNNDGSVLLLNHCSSLTCLEVTLSGPKVLILNDDVNLIKDKVPHLPQITSLTVNVYRAFERHNFGVGVANLLTRFTNLRHLKLHLPFFLTLYYDLDRGLGLECDHPNHWTSDDIISLAHLKEMELTGLTGTDCELWFMEAVLASARRLCKVALSFNEKCQQHGRKMDAFERMLIDEGIRTSCRTKHKLTCSLEY